MNEDTESGPNKSDPIEVVGDGDTESTTEASDSGNSSEAENKESDIVAGTEATDDDPASDEQPSEPNTGRSIVLFRPELPAYESMPTDAFDAIHKLRHWMDLADRQGSIVDDWTEKAMVRLMPALGMLREAERGGLAAVGVLIAHPFFRGRVRKPSARQLPNVCVQLATKPMTEKLRKLCSSQAPLIECACDDGIEVEDFLAYAEAVTLTECRKRVAAKHGKPKEEVIIRLSVPTLGGKTKVVSWKVHAAVAFALTQRVKEREEDESWTKDLSADFLDLAEVAERAARADAPTLVPSDEALLEDASYLDEESNNDPDDADEDGEPDGQTTA